MSINRCPACASASTHLLDWKFSGLGDSVFNYTADFHDSAAVAITTERLCGEETGRRGVTKGAQSTVVVCRPKALRGIIENQQVFGFSRNCNGTVVSRQAKQIDRDERFRL